MFLFDLVDAEGQVLGNQGYSIGSGWEVSEDGFEISHAKRRNVVATTRYGQLQQRVVAVLQVNMREYGTPIDARTWEGLGFHWMLEAHETLREIEPGKREQKQGLMPTEFIGVNEQIRSSGGFVQEEGGEGDEGEGEGEEAVEEPKMSDALMKKLTELAQTNVLKDFQRAAVRMPEVAKSDAIMNYVMEDGPDGFFSRHQK
jgi:hypothetical protein